MRGPEVPPARNSTLRVTYLIARRELVTRVRSRFFTIGTAVLIILVVGYVLLQAFVLNRAATTVKVGFSGQAQVLERRVEASSAALGLHVDARTVPDVGTGEAEVRAGSLDALVSGDPAAPATAVKDQLDPSLQAALTAAVRQQALERALTAQRVDPLPIEAKTAAAGIRLVTLDPQAAQRTERAVAGIAVAAILYVAIAVYGQIVASGVVEEKANRIVEILLSTVRPWQLLFGKVIGIGLVGILQLVLVGAAAILAVVRTQVLSVPSVGVIAIVGGLFWFVLGFLLYAILYAAGGSLVSRQEDLGAVTTPITMIVLGTYLAFFWVVGNPDSPVAVALSIFPAFAPVLMPARMATGDAQAWQVVLAAALTVASIAGLNALGARIYANSVMRTGVRIKLRQAWGGRD